MDGHNTLSFDAQFVAKAFDQADERLKAAIMVLLRPEITESKEIKNCKIVKLNPKKAVV
jgi:hypothetical protein